MAQVTITTQVVIDDVYGGKETLPKATFSQTFTETYRQNFSLADTVAVVAWDPNSASVAVTAFSVAVIRTDATAGVDVEGVIDDTGTAGAYNSWRVMDKLPFCLGADDGYQTDGVTTAAFGNTLDVYDKFRFVNPTTSTTVNVTLILFS